jgi:hypothetical protein
MIGAGILTGNGIERKLRGIEIKSGIAIIVLRIRGKDIGIFTSHFIHELDANINVHFMGVSL